MNKARIWVIVCGTGILIGLIAVGAALVSSPPRRSKIVKLEEPNIPSEPGSSRTSSATNDAFLTMSRTAPVAPPAPARLTSDENEIALERGTRAAFMAQAKVERKRLALQRPLEFLSAIIPPSAGRAVTASAREKAGQFVNVRLAILTQMIDNYVASDGSYDFEADLDQLEQNDRDFEQSVASLRESMPQIVELPRALANTALPVPSFARDSAQLRTPQNVVVYQDPAAR
jgi:hypothetical protein